MATSDVVMSTPDDHLDHDDSHALLDRARGLASTAISPPIEQKLQIERIMLSQAKAAHRLTQGGRITKFRQPQPHPSRPSFSTRPSSSSTTSATFSPSSTPGASTTSLPLPLAKPRTIATSPDRKTSIEEEKLPKRRANYTYNTRSSSSSSLNSESSGANLGASSTSSSSPRVNYAFHQAQQQQPQQQQQHDDIMPSADHDPVLTFWGPDPVPLPSRFARIKRNLIAGHEEALEASWVRLIGALRAEMDHIEGLGAHLIPSIEFTDLEDTHQTTRFGRDLRRYGVGVVRRAVPKHDADDMVHSTVQYLDTLRNHEVKTLQQDPTCYDFFWTPAQVRSRAHPSVLQAQRFMMSLWESNPENRLATRLPITYVDRIRIHGTQKTANGLQLNPPTNTNGASPTIDLPTAMEEPQSADDWITALQSSAGIIAQVDNGSLERWEPDGYGRGGTYKSVFHGDWEAYDPWECASRVASTTDLYNGYGACTIFRMFQGVLALSTIEPGMIRLLPSPKLATAYYLLRPFFSAKTPAPDVRSGPDWEAYLSPSNWKLERDPDTIIHGAVPGHAQRITERWHPHLHLRGSMITLPTLQPGDYIFWHPDLPYHISSNSPGLQTPRNQPEPSMLVYIPAAPLTQTNALYLARQRKAFQRGNPSPDFDSSGRGMNVEDPDKRPGEKEIAEIGGPAGLQAMGLAPWEVAATRAGTPPLAEKERRVKNGVGGADEETKSLSSASSTSSAEAEVVRLSNIILFPDRSMMGYSM